MEGNGWFKREIGRSMGMEGFGGGVLLGCGKKGLNMW